MIFPVRDPEEGNPLNSLIKGSGLALPWTGLFTWGLVWAWIQCKVFGVDDHFQV
jgi:hypothetical protein